MKKGAGIDLVKLLLYILKHGWLLILCGAIGCGVMYWRTASRQIDTYTASGTMYVYNGNPNMVNYQYASSMDLTSAVQLLDTYSVVVKSNKVLDAVAERLSQDYPYITAEFIGSTLYMSSVQDTGVMRVSCRTTNPQMSADICNAVLDVAPAEIIRVVNAGGTEIIDYASVPVSADARGVMRNLLIGGVGGAFLAAAVLAVLFFFNQRITTAKELTDNYTPPVLAEVCLDKQKRETPGAFLLSDKSAMDIIESYAKLRMNLFYTLVGKESHAVMVTSAVSGEGKSTIAANLAISCGMSGRKVLLVDADMRRAWQREMFSQQGQELPGLSEVLVGGCAWKDAVIHNREHGIDLLPAGRIPPNPTELLESQDMQRLISKLSEKYDLVLLDSPPVNIVSDPLALSDKVAGALFVVRQDVSDHREVRKALIAAEMANLELLGFIFYAESLLHGSYYSRKHYRNYYQKNENRGPITVRKAEADEENETKDPKGKKRMAASDPDDLGSVDLLRRGG